MTKKTSCTHSDLMKIGKKLADLEDWNTTLNDRRREHGLEENEQEKLHDTDTQIEQLRTKIEDCGEDPDLYTQWGMNALEKEENTEENEDEK